MSKRPELDHALREHLIKCTVPEVIELFLSKNEDYGVGHNEFGAKGEVIEISRKYKKLKDAIWNEVELQGEQPIEVAYDMIGHLILLIHEIRGKGHSADSSMSAQEWRMAYESAFMTEENFH